MTFGSMSSSRVGWVEDSAVMQCVGPITESVDVYPRVSC